ncbi:hypothetical protein Tco_0783894 [Tanacetum coccineum]
MSTIINILNFHRRGCFKFYSSPITQGAGGLFGRMIENRMGVIGLLCVGIESGMVAVRDVDDVFNSVVVGMGTGALFKAVSGVLSAALAGVIGGITVSSVVDEK